MHPKLVIFFAFSFVTATLFCLFIEGSYLGEEELTVMNALTGMSVVEVSGSGAWAVPKLLVGFFTVGVPRLLLWDYSFLASADGGLFKWIVLFPLTVGFVWGLAQVFIPVVQGLFAR